MKESTFFAIIGWVLAALWFLFDQYDCHRWTEDVQAYRVEAVNHRAAEWRVSEDGKVTFHWITKKECKPSH